MVGGSPGIGQVQPTKLQDLDHDEASLLNASIPFSREVVVAARPLAV